VRDERPVEHAESLPDDAGARPDPTDVLDRVDQLEPAQARRQRAAAGAVAGVDEVVPPDRVREDSIGAAARQRDPEHEGVAAAHPDRVDALQGSLDGIGAFELPQVELVRPQSQPGQVVELPRDALAPDVRRGAVDRVGDHRGPRTFPGQPDQVLGVVAEPEGRQVEAHGGNGAAPDGVRVPPSGHDHW
jgi:hypothetical protein